MTLIGACGAPSSSATIRCRQGVTKLHRNRYLACSTSSPSPSSPPSLPLRCPPTCRAGGLTRTPTVSNQGDGTCGQERVIRSHEMEISARADGTSAAAEAAAETGMRVPRILLADCSNSYRHRHRLPNAQPPDFPRKILLPKQLKMPCRLKKKNVGSQEVQFG